MQEVEMLGGLYLFLYSLTEPLSCFLESNLKKIYKNSLWRVTVLNKLKKEDLDTIKKRNIDGFSGLDIVLLLKILIVNYQELCFDIELCETIRNVRNKVAHPAINKMRYEMFSAYLDDLYRFGKCIGLDQKILTKLVNTKIEYLYQQPQAVQKEIEDDDTMLKNKLLETIKNRVLIPALKCKTLDEDIKDSVLDTRDRLKIKKHSKEIYDFFKDALRAKRGKIVYAELKKNNLTAFEDIVQEIENIYEGHQK